MQAGRAILFPQGKVHMTQNTGDMPMKVACFFAPATDLANYKFSEDMQLPE